jgi:hypothetical protein
MTLAVGGVQPPRGRQGGGTAVCKVPAARCGWSDVCGVPQPATGVTKCNVGSCEGRTTQAGQVHPPSAASHTTVCSCLLLTRNRQLRLLGGTDRGQDDQQAGHGQAGPSEPGRPSDFRHCREVLGGVRASGVWSFPNKDVDDCRVWGMASGVRSRQLALACGCLFLASVPRAVPGAVQPLTAAVTMTWCTCAHQELSAALSCSST